MKPFDNAGRPVKRERVSVLYRMDNPPGPRAQVTAIFPQMSEGPGRFTCYAHIGQHGTASREWIRESTRPATPSEYASLHAELSQIYTGDCALVIRKRFPSWHARAPVVGDHNRKGGFMARSGFLSTHAGQWCAVVGALPICPMGPRDQAEAAARQLGVQLDGRTWDGDAGRWIPPPQEDRPPASRPPASRPSASYRGPSMLDGGDPLDRRYSVADIAPESVKMTDETLAGFESDNAADITASDMTPEQLGHDFWLTRNRHGAGFWDRGYPDGIGERLTTNTRPYGSSDAYVGDDGKVYLT